MEKTDLRRLPAAPRTLAIGFLISLGLAYGVALLLVFVQSEMKPAGIESQYRGTPESTAPMESSDPQATPEAEPGDETSSVDEASVPTLREEWGHRSAGMKFPKSLKDMILTTHLHLLSISMILFLVGGLFVFSSAPERLKALVIAAGFIGLVSTYACMWALRYVSGTFSIGVFCFGALQAVAMTAQFLICLRDLLFFRPRAGTQE